MANNVGQQPPSPSAMHLYQSASPTTPTHVDHARHKGYTLEEVHSWSEAKVAEWLSHLNHGRHRNKFIENNITGAVLLDLDNEALKAMDIRTVGERVKLLVAVRSLRQECYAAVANAARARIAHGDQRADYRMHNQSSTSIATAQTLTAGSSLYHIDGHGKHEGFNVTSPHSEKSSKSSEGKSLLNRSNSFSRFLGRSDSKKSSRSGQDVPPMPPSPKTIQKRKSLEKGIMSMEKVKQTCVKVFGEEGQTRIVNVHNTSDAKAIMAKVLHKFGIDECNADRYCIFVGSSTNGEARALKDDELVEICRSADRPEKERLILRKRHMYPTHEEFKRKGTTNWKFPRNPMQSDIDNTSAFSIHSPSISAETPQPWMPDKQMTLDIITGSSSTDSLSSRASRRPQNQARVRRFFGERPPSEVISSNLPSFFPNHKREMLETAGINAKRMSMTRTSSMARRESRAAFRNSVLPELVSVLGVDLGKFLEEEEETADTQALETMSQQDMEDKEKDEDKQEETVSTTATPPAEEEEGENDHKSVNVPSIIEEPETPSSSTVTQSTTVTETTDTPDSNEPERDAPMISDDSPLAWMKGSLIGRGTFGDVYLGLNPLNGELMAVKQVELPVENSATENQKRSMVEALQREIALLKELQHENIVQYLGSQTDMAHFSIFLEYVPGGSVAGLLASYGAFQEPLVQSFVRQILKGLNYLHGKDIVHRDIKGANVLVDNKGGVKISDFGISKKVEEDIMQVSSAAHRPSLQGSIFWMAPEVVKQTHYTRKADIWSLGCMVVEMFTGDHPFPEFSQMQAIFKIGSYTAPNIPENISEEAKDFLKCTFKLNHEERPSAKELLDHPFLKI